MPRWPILLRVTNFLDLEVTDLLPWNQLSTPYKHALNQLRANALPSQYGIFSYLKWMYDRGTVDATGLPWLLRTSPQPPDVVANVEQNIYALLVEKDIISLQHNQWLNDNVINFVLNRLVHFQDSRTYTGKLTYLYDTRFYPANLAQDPIVLSRISKQTRAPLRPYTESQRRGGGLFYQNENVLDPSNYKFVFIPRHNNSDHWQFVLLVPGLRRMYFGDPYGVGLDSPLLTRGIAGTVLDQVEQFIEVYERSHERRGVHPPWTRQSFFPRKVQEDSSSCGLFVLLVPFLLIQLSMLRPSCDEQLTIEFVRNFVRGMQMGIGPNAKKMRNWVMFSIATNQIVPNGKQVATRSIPALGQPILVDDGPIAQDICIICMEELSADNEESPLVINLNRNCTHQLHRDCAQRLIENQRQNPHFPSSVEMFNQQLHPLAACPACKRGGGWAYATTRQLLERSMLGWRRKVMIGVPSSVPGSAGQSQREATFTWRHQYCSLRVNGSAAAHASVIYGQRDEGFVLNMVDNYRATTCDWVAVTNRDEWNKHCIAAQCPDYICLPTGTQIFNTSDDIGSTE